MTSVGPTMRRKQLGKQLRELRQQAGISMDEAADALGCARSRISHIETGRNAPRKPDLEVLLRRYGAVDKLEPLEQLRREGGKRGWWSTYRLPSWLSGYVGLEADATIARCFAVELLPGLLQSPNYARQVHVKGGMHAMPADDVERGVAARLKRQERLSDDSDPLQLSAVISEGALRRLLADDSATAAEQLRHLEAHASLANVSLHVLPFDAGLHSSMSGSFTLLRFASGVSSDVAYQEYAVGGHLVDEDDVIQRLFNLYDALRDQALGRDESLEMISELAQRIGR